MNYKWNLDILYSGFEDESFTADTKLLDSHIERLVSLSEHAGEMDSLSLIREFLSVQNDLTLVTSKLFI